MIESQVTYVNFIIVINVIKKAVNKLLTFYLFFVN